MRAFYDGIYNVLILLPRASSCFILLDFVSVLCGFLYSNKSIFLILNVHVVLFKSEMGAFFLVVNIKEDWEASCPFSHFLLLLCTKTVQKPNSPRKNCPSTCVPVIPVFQMSRLDAASPLVNLYPYEMIWRDKSRPNNRFLNACRPWWTANRHRHTTDGARSTDKPVTMAHPEHFMLS